MYQLFFYPSTVNMSLPPSALTGVTVPTQRYSNALTEEFPSQNRNYLVEAGISSRLRRDFLPANSSISNGGISDSYIEFNLTSNQQEFFDLQSFAIETKIKLVKGANLDIAKEDNVSVIDGLGHRLFSKCTVFFNGTPVSGNTYFGLHNSVRTYLTMGEHSLRSTGRLMYYKSIDTDIEDEITMKNFEIGKITKDERTVIDECKTVLHTLTPLDLDIASANFYLLNGVDIRIRLDLAPRELIINAPDGASKQYSYELQLAKLWCEKVVPYPSALLSLNKNLISGNGTIEYLFDKPIVKNYIFPAGHSTLTLENIFNGYVPRVVYVYLLKQSALTGVYNKNGAYLTHANISNIRLDINGNTFSSTTSSFPDSIAQLFHHTLSNIKDANHLLTYHSFKKGRTVFCWNLSPTDCKDVLHIEKSGNIRINIQTESPPTENLAVFVTGITTGIIDVDHSRRVKTTFLM